MNVDGIGIEVRATSMHGVRVAGDGSPRIVATADEAVPDPAPDDDLVVAFERIAARLGTGARPVRLAWFPAGATVKAHETTGRSTSDVEALTVQLEADGVAAVTTVAAGDARWLLAVTWDHRRAARLGQLAGRAGLRVEACEPSPLALARVLPTTPTMAGRSGSSASGWQAVVTDGVALLAVSTPVLGRRHPDLTTTPLDTDGAAGPPPSAGLGRRSADAAADRPTLVLGGRPFLGDPPSDAGAAGRQAVALGAALAAAGLVATVHPLVPFSPVLDRRPWVIERMDAEPVTERESPWWRRLRDRLRRR